MPEGPEAQTIVTGLRPLIGAIIQSVHLGRKDFLKTGRPGDLQHLCGGRLVDVSRRGKCVVLHIESRRLLLQLGMAGRVNISAAEDPLAGHTHLVLALGDGREIRYANARRIAAGVHLLEGDRQGPAAGMGPEATQITATEFISRVGRRKAPIKAVLLNQSVLAGVGNIYSDEALFRAGIRPGRRADRLNADRLRRLHRAVRGVLAEAIRAGGSTIKGANPYAGAGGELGKFTLRHKVYGRYGQKCRACGDTLRRTQIGGRTSTFCPTCQS
jgi:formamidopyrimidine-DNA glycosylase